MTENSSMDVARLEDRLTRVENLLEKEDKPAGWDIANPAPLGLFGFGITTILLNFKNSTAAEPNFIHLVLGYGFFYGGLAQLLAGMWEFKKNNTFGATAFSSYGAFWIGLSFWHLMMDLGVWTSHVEWETGWTLYFCTWGVFTLCMYFGTFRAPTALQTVFLSLAILFFLLAGGVHDKTVEKIAGIEGIFCGCTAFYTAWATIINGQYGRTILPLDLADVFPPKKFDDEDEVQAKDINGITLL